VPALSDIVGMDLSSYPLDGPLPDPLPHVMAGIDASIAGAG